MTVFNFCGLCGSKNPGRTVDVVDRLRGFAAGRHWTSLVIGSATHVYVAVGLEVSLALNSGTIGLSGGLSFAHFFAAVIHGSEGLADVFLVGTG